MLIKLGRLEYGAEAFEKALKENPGDFYAMKGLDWTLGTLGRSSMSLVKWNSFIDQNPGHAEAHFLRAPVHLADDTLRQRLSSYLLASPVSSSGFQTFSFPPFVLCEPEATYPFIVGT